MTRDLFVYLLFFLLSISASAGLLGDSQKVSDVFAWKLHFQTERFLKEKYDVSDGSHFLLANPNLRYFAGLSLDVHNEFLDVSTRYTYSVREEHHYIRPYEVAFKIQRADGQWVIGRYRLEWDWADHLWNRGLWEPFYREDALRARQGGLLGIFRQFYYDNVHLTLFGSPVFVPESGPHFIEKNGRLISNNSWFVPPPNKKIGFTNIVPSYRLTPVSWKDALQLSLGGRVEYDKFYIAYAYKPINAVNVKSAINLDLSKALKGSYEEGYSAPIVLEPVLLKHHLAVLGWKVEQAYDSSAGLQNIYRLKTSLTYNHPETLVLKKSESIFFQPKKEWHFSIKGEFNIQDTMEETTLYVSYTHQFYGKDFQKSTLLSEVFPDPNEQQFFRNDLFQFDQAASVGLNHSLKWTDAQSTHVKARLIYHFSKKYFLFSGHGSITINKSVSMFIAGDILFTTFPFYTDQTTEDIGPYKNKSRVFGGLSYVF